ncbi:hypothetical protein BDQ17DRAFT_1331807 [Cyathus striatus]|nr:hypothetical protein BDQ17DRAFT_1331807 [Cyathus striatus]
MSFNYNIPLSVYSSACSLLMSNYRRSSHALHYFQKFCVTDPLDKKHTWLIEELANLYTSTKKAGKEESFWGLVHSKWKQTYPVDLKQNTLTKRTKSEENQVQFKVLWTYCWPLKGRNDKDWEGIHIQDWRKCLPELFIEARQDKAKILGKTGKPWAGTLDKIQGCWEDRETIGWDFGRSWGKVGAIKAQAMQIHNDIVPANEYTICVSDNFINGSLCFLPPSHAVKNVLEVQYILHLKYLDLSTCGVIETKSESVSENGVHAGGSGRGILGPIFHSIWFYSASRGPKTTIPHQNNMPHWLRHITTVDDEHS